MLHDKSIILIDDANPPGAGKPRLATQVLRKNGWRLVLKDQQVLWVKE
jgi:hypothetical protein